MPVQATVLRSALAINLLTACVLFLLVVLCGHLALVVDAHVLGGALQPFLLVPKIADSHVGDVLAALAPEVHDGGASMLGGVGVPGGVSVLGLDADGLFGGACVVGIVSFLTSGYFWGMPLRAAFPTHTHTPFLSFAPRPLAAHTWRRSGEPGRLHSEPELTV